MKRAAILFAALGLFLAAPLALAGDPCDYNGDGVVDQTDGQLIQAAAAENSTEGDPLWNPMMDHDGDGVISLADVMYFTQHKS